MSRIKRRVKPIDPAPIIATLIAMFTLLLGLGMKNTVSIIAWSAISVQRISHYNYTVRIP
jgi:hypothetical protein